MEKFWKWGSDEEDPDAEDTNGVGFVVFGDSWVDDTIDVGGEGKGKSWTEVFCKEVRLNPENMIATSQWVLHQSLFQHTCSH